MTSLYWWLSSAKEHTAEIIMSCSESVYIPRHYDAAPRGLGQGPLLVMLTIDRPSVRPSVHFDPVELFGFG
jgi:hypothetical protein